MRTLIVCLAVILTLGFSDLVMAQEIPGGIVFCDGKEIFFQSFQTSQKISLMGDLTGPPIKGPATISEDGTVLIWLFDGKFYFRQIPYGMPFATPIVKSNKSEPVLLPENVRNVTLSPQGNQYSYESTEKGNAWIQVEPGKSKPDARDWNTLPKYVEKVDTFNAITLFNIRDDISEKFNRLGNTTECPPVLPVRITPPLVTGVKAVAALMIQPPPRSFGAIHLSDQETINKFSTKRDAKFLTWQKASSWKPNNQLVAFIYQTPAGWGPIEIRDVNENRDIRDLNRIKEAGIKNVKPGFWEIDITLKSCEGLAWKPDGSLTYLANGKVFCLDSANIKAGIEKSGIVPDKKHLTDFGAVANVFHIDSTMVADIQGDKLHWVSNDTFLFRGKNNSLYCHRQGNVEKLLTEVPEEFSFCDTPPLNYTVVASGARKLGDELFFTNHTSDYFVGNAKIHWSQAVGVMDPPFWVSNQEGLEFAFPTERNIEDIKNPSGYEYKKVSSVTTGGFKLQVAPGQIVLLRLDGKITAVKVINFERKYKSVAEMPKALQGSWKEMGNDRLPFWGWAPIEWKHWRNPPSTTGLAKDTPKSAAKVENKLTNAGNAGKSEAIGRSMEPSNKYNPRSEVYFTIGDIKTVGSVRKVERIEGSKSTLHLMLSVCTNSIPGCGYIVLPENTNIEVINNPEIYQYKSDNVQGAYLRFIQMKQIIVFKIPGDKYAAIRPIEIRQDTNGVPTVIYEWKYWPTVPNQAVATSSNLAKE